mmetsp:Transcript_101632/g.322814  ORF Transcript_101632/g.322814 Transcript_101632/m.322814 type:complete len:325 (-) Transcript_101632:143-1117(-)
MPPPHVTEHAGHAVHSPHWQSTTHSCWMQGPCSTPIPSQSFPPYFASRAFPRLRACVPLPHAALHAPQDFHSSHLQSMGQESVLHSMVSFKGPAHAFPPPTASDLIRRVLVALPKPQVFEHSPHLPQGPHLQATGQSPDMHSRVSFAGPMQHLPPCMAFLVTFLKRMIWPPPQVTEQLDQRFHSPHSQSIGHGLKLQASSTWLPPVQSLPPKRARSFLLRFRVITPPPQASEHCDQGDQVSQTQSRLKDDTPGIFFHQRLLLSALSCAVGGSPSSSVRTAPSSPASSPGSRAPATPLGASESSARMTCRRPRDAGLSSSCSPGC